MRALIVSLATATLIGATWTAAPAQARPRPRSVYCHYRDADGQPGWSTSDVKLLIRCAAARFGVSVDTALYVANRESGYHWWARNRSSGTCGIFQHMPRYWPGRVATFRSKHPFWTISSNCYNARANVLVALDMVRRHGWGPWSL